jgi:hypothetical protein
MYVYCIYLLAEHHKEMAIFTWCITKDRKKRHSSPFINVVKGVFFVVRVTLVPVSYLSAPSTVHSYRVPGKFIRRQIVCTRRDLTHTIATLQHHSLSLVSSALIHSVTSAVYWYLSCNQYICCTNMLYRRICSILWLNYQQSKRNR